jgi:hypothetical protein
MSDWPEIPFPPWRETAAALHLYLQVIGKYRLARTPWLNHSWHATLYLNGRGLTTSLVSDGSRGVEIAVDLIDHAVVGTATDGRRAAFPLRAMSVARFHAETLDLLRALGATRDFDGKPNEVLDPVPFAEDTTERPYDAAAVTRFFHALVATQRVLERFRSGYLGKVSPIHFFWGSFDLAVTRFSGRPAPLHPGGVPALPDPVAREAYSHEVASAGFWPGGGLSGVEMPAFYAYAYPMPAGFAEARVEPAEARFDARLGEFLLPYDAVRTAPDPDATLLRFLESTYRAAATNAAWDRAALECDYGVPRRPRSV